MPDVRFYRATKSDAEVLAKDMRAADVREVERTGQTPRQALLTSLKQSDVAFTARFDGHIAFMFGVGPAFPPNTLLGSVDVGWAWLLTGNRCNQSPRSFLRHREWCMRMLLEKYPTILSFVDAEYKGALRLVRRLGFKQGDEVEFQPGYPFVTIHIRRDTWAQ